VSKKASPPKELSLKEQAIAQDTAARTKDEMLAAKRRALQVDNGGLKREKARGPLELLEKHRKEAGAGKEDIRAVHPPGCNQGQGALERRRRIGSNVPQGAAAEEYQSPQGAVLTHAGDRGACVEARGGAQIGGGSSQ
jgi:hypothetical protein